MTKFKFNPNKSTTSDGLDNPDVTNGDRADWAASAVEDFKTHCAIGDVGVAEEHIGDLLADLMHLCDREEIDFEQCLDSGRRH